MRTGRVRDEIFQLLYCFAPLSTHNFIIFASLRVKRYMLYMEENDDIGIK